MTGGALREESNATDSALIARWRAGEQSAATAIVERHAAALTRFAVSLGERTDLDELVQDTLVRAFGALDSFRGESSLRTWLFTILRRLALDRRRAGRRQRGRVEITESDAVTEYSPLDGVVAQETETRVRRAVERLTRMQREVFTLRVTEGLSYKEIADVVGSTEGAARVHYHNAMRSVKEFLDDE